MEYNQGDPIPQPAKRATVLPEWNLREMREQADLSQAQVAEEMGVSQQAVGKWEKDNNPHKAWPRLAKLYGVRMQYPSEPFDVKERAEWLKLRAESIRHYKPNVPIIGAGKYSEATGKPL